MAIQDLCDGVSDVSGIRILYLNAEDNLFLDLRKKELEDVTKFVLEFNVK